VDRAFLDANVLFSAAYDPASRISGLWDLPQTELVTSSYAAAEAFRNLAEKRPARLKRLGQLLEATALVREDVPQEWPTGVTLPEEDQPILLAALGCRATHLLTGDKHFRPYFGRTISGTLILRPGDYLLLCGA
jgi:uncharacterized protein